MSGTIQLYGKRDVRRTTADEAYDGGTKIPLSVVLAVGRKPEGHSL